MFQCSLAGSWVNVNARFKHKTLIENISESTMSISLQFLFAQSSNSRGCRRSFRWTLWKYCVRQAIEVGHYPNKGQLWGESREQFVWRCIIVYKSYNTLESNIWFSDSPGLQLLIRSHSCVLHITHPYTIWRFSWCFTELHCEDIW